MVATTVLEGEVTVEDLGVGPHSRGLVDSLAPVDQFVACETIDAGHVAPHEGEHGPVKEAVSVPVLEDPGELGAFQGIHSTCDVQAPKPVEGIVDDEGVDWQHEALVLCEDLLAGRVKIIFEVAAAPKLFAGDDVR